eukprot:3651064-Rhodomonas_salina.1
MAVHSIPPITSFRPVHAAPEVEMASIHKVRAVEQSCLTESSLQSRLGARGNSGGGVFQAKSLPLPSNFDSVHRG